MPLEHQGGQCGCSRGGGVHDESKGNQGPDQVRPFRPSYGLWVSFHMRWDPLKGFHQGTTLSELRLNKITLAAGRKLPRWGRTGLGKTRVEAVVASRVEMTHGWTRALAMVVDRDGPRIRVLPAFLLSPYTCHTVPGTGDTAANQTEILASWGV